MTNLFIVYVAAFFLPILFHSWRVAVIGLGAQGLLHALILACGHEWDGQAYFEFFSLVIIRAWFVPWYVLRQMRGHDTASDFALIPKNLAQWLLAFALLAAAFVFGHKMSPEDPVEALQVGTAAGAILISLLVLANQHHPMGQVVGLLTFEGGITLVELLSPHAMPFPVSVGVSLVTISLVLICGHFLKQMLTLSPDSENVEDTVTL